MPRITRSVEDQAQADRHGPDFLDVLARGLRVLGSFDDAPHPLTLSDVADRVGIARASARRALLTLAALGFVETNGRTFRLTPKVLTLARAFLTSNPVAAVMQPIVERVSAETNEACSAALLDGQEVVFVARASPTRILTVGLEIGYRLPAHATAVGRVLLAALDDRQLDARLAQAEPVILTDRTLVDPARLKAAILEVRRSGLSVVDGEVERGFLSVAVPVRNARGGLSCAIHLGLHVQGEADRDRLDPLVACLRRAATSAETMLV